MFLRAAVFFCYSAAKSFAAERQDVLPQSDRFFCGSATRCFAVPWQIGRNVPIVGLLALWVSSGFGWRDVRLNTFVVESRSAQGVALRQDKAAAAPSNPRQRHSYLDIQRHLYLESAPS